jgi:hypothetical protein
LLGGIKHDQIHVKDFGEHCTPPLFDVVNDEAAYIYDFGIRL